MVPAGHIHVPLGTCSSIWTMGTLEGLLPFHKFWPQDGAGGQKLGHLKKCYTLFLLC